MNVLMGEKYVVLNGCAYNNLEQGAKFEKESTVATRQNRERWERRQRN
jgi:hypothetical protein